MKVVRRRSQVGRAWRLIHRCDGLAGTGLEILGYINFRKRASSTATLVHDSLISQPL